jgi:hypothetical protein
MFRHLDLDSLPTGHRTRGQYAMRYEDVAQDGTIKLTAIAPAFGPACYRPLWRSHPVNERMIQQGVLAILTGMRLEMLGGPIAVMESLSAEGGYMLAHEQDAAGNVTRVFLNLQVNVSGTRGVTHGKQPPGAGEPIAVGRAFAEHVFTRPFGPPDQRKVLALEGPEGLFVPPERYAWPDAQQLLALHVEDRALTDFVAETITFGLIHTDANQHVNSLVYPSLFEQAVVRRVHALGLKDVGLGRLIDIAYRRPCFAGDVMSLQVQLLRTRDGLTAIGYFAKPNEPPQRAHCTLRLVLSSTGRV